VQQKPCQNVEPLLITDPQTQATQRQIEQRTDGTAQRSSPRRATVMSGRQHSRVGERQR
jgi:hypothetical protein